MRLPWAFVLGPADSPPAPYFPCRAATERLCSACWRLCRPSRSRRCACVCRLSKLIQADRIAGTCTFYVSGGGTGCARTMSSLPRLRRGSATSRRPLSPSRPLQLLSTVVSKGRTLLHLAVESRDVRLTAEVLEMVSGRWVEGLRAFTGEAPLSPPRLPPSRLPRLVRALLPTYLALACLPSQLPQHANVITQPEASCPLVLALQQHAALKEEQRKLPERHAEERAAAEAAAIKAAAEVSKQSGGGVVQAISRMLTGSATAAQRAAQQEAEDAAAAERQQLEQRQAGERKAAAAAVKEADALLKAFLKAWRPSFLAKLLVADLAPAQRNLVSTFARDHAATVLAPVLQVGWWLRQLHWSSSAVWVGGQLLR